MSLVLGDNFSYQGSKPLDARLSYNTLADMKAVADATMYDGCMAYCEATGKTYQWKSTNTVDTNTGKWREFSSGSGGGSGHVIVDGEGVEYTQRSKLVFMNSTVADDPTSDSTIVTPEGGGGADVPIGDVTGASVLQSGSSASAIIKWTDPNDVTIEGVTMAYWAGTVVVRKAGSAPQSVSDGTLVVENTLKNQYSSTGYVDSGLEYGVTYYYRFYPYKMAGATKSYNTGGVVENCTIARTKISYTPTTASSFTYDGTEKTPVWSNYNSDQLQIGGDTSGINADTYTATFTPKTGYEWSDGTLTARSVNWTIAQKAVTVPLLSGSYTYNGTSQSVTISSYDSNEVTVGGDISGTNAGTYTVTFTLGSANYKWNDNTTAQKSATWTIAKVTVTPPTVTSELVYTGSQQTATVSSYDSNLVSVTGITGTNAGSYNATLSLEETNNHEWDDGTIIDKNVAWSIAKANQSFILSKDIIILEDYHETDTITVSNATGEVTITSSDNSKVSVSPSIISGGSGTVTVTKLTNDDLVESLTFTIAGSANYNAYTVNVPTVTDYSLEVASWSSIKNIGANGTGANFFSIGDSKTIHLQGAIGNYKTVDSDYKVFIIEFNYRGDNGIYFQGFKDVNNNDIALCDTSYGTSNANLMFSMNHFANAHNGGGWKGCDLRYDILGSVETPPSIYMDSKLDDVTGYDATTQAIISPVENTLMASLPNDLRNVLAQWVVYTDNVGHNTNSPDSVTTSVDYIILLSGYEVWGNSSNISYVNASEYSDNKQLQMTYYANGNAKRRYKDNEPTTVCNYWILRSPKINNWNDFVTTNYAFSKDRLDSVIANNSIGICPAFRVA